MSWRIAIRHHTGYQYESEVESSYNEARLTPLTTLNQITLDSALDVSPTATVLRYWDYWGTLVHAFDVHVPHTELSVTATAVVETGDPPPSTPTLDWAGLRAAADEHAELLAPTDYVHHSPELADEGRELAASADPREACAGAVEWTRSRLRYEHGITTVASNAETALEHGVGVCQDFAHVTLAILRAAGIPSRYVSGYLHPLDGASMGETVQGESHAWVEAWVGDWLPLDPTSGTYEPSNHVIVGRGRDYADVAPLKGIFHGGACRALAVSVELTRRA